ncbi:MAG: peptidylprolyl isomerase [Bacteroidota bacterium]
MTVLERLRKRSGLLVSIVGLALLAFVLTGLFESRFSFFTDKQVVGSIFGEDISLQDFQMEVEKMAEQQRMNSGSNSLDEQAMEMVNNNAWDKLVRDRVLVSQINRSGISVSDAELSEMLWGKEIDPMVRGAFVDQQTQKVNPQFANEQTGELDGAKIYKFVNEQMDNPQNPDFKPRWLKFEEGIRESRLNNKYMTAIKKGLYVTTSYAKAEYLALNNSVNFKYVLKRYQTLADSQVKVTEEEIEKYYNEHKSQYKQEASRKIEYVVFDVLPSEEDIKAKEEQMAKLADEFRKTDNDSAFVMRESENKYFDNNYLKKNQLPPGVDTTFFNAEKGTVFGPYKEMNKIKVSKLVNSKMSVDSGSCRHILVAYQGASSADPSVTQTKEQAKARADSLLKAFKSKGTKNFEAAVKKFSADKGSVEKGGKYEWFKEGQMVPEFQNAVFNGKKGDLSIAETVYGFHVIEVLDVGGKSRKVQVATIEHAIEPSTKTKQEVFDKATDFAITYNTKELFEKGIEKEKLSKRIADPVKESDKTIAGLDSPKELIRWAYEVEEGAVSVEPFSFTNKYVVALVSEVREKGFASLDQEQTRNEVELKAKQQKKAQMFAEEFRKVLSGAKSIDDVAKNMNFPVEMSENVTFGSYSIANLGRELELMGILFTLKEGQLSQPIAGQQGVYVAVVEKINKATETKDYSASKNQAKTTVQYRVDSEVFNALKTNAEIEDNRARFF